MNKMQQKQENKWRQMRQVRQLSTTKTNAPNDTISPTHTLSRSLSFISLSLTHTHTDRETHLEPGNCYTAAKSARSLLNTSAYPLGFARERERAAIEDGSRQSTASAAFRDSSRAECGSGSGRGSGSCQLHVVSCQQPTK